MLPRHTLLLAFQSLLAATALAAPVEVPAELVPRQTACPVATRWQSYWYTTTWLATTTVTNGWSSLGSVTSTKTESETRTINKVETVYSPSVTTLPTTTITTVVATVSADVTWFTSTETVTSPGYAPPSLCQVTTVTSSIPSTTSVTVTRPLLYDTTWKSTTGHVRTTTEIYFTTSTRTVTVPGSTTYEVTVTQPTTKSLLDITDTTITSTVWAQGCQTWACQL